MAVTARYKDSTRSTRHLGLLLDFAARSRARAVALLVLAALLNFLPGVFEIPPIDRDEARLAQATKQMIESGDYVDIRFQEEARSRPTSAAGAADFLAAGDCHFDLIEARQERAFAERAEAISLRYAPGPRIDGFNISNLQVITIAVFRSESPL